MASIDVARGRHAILQDATVRRDLPSQTLDFLSQGNSSTFLEAVAEGALIPTSTLRFFAHFQDIFADTCARWVSISNERIRKHQIVSAFARILPFAPHLSIYLERYLSNNTTTSPQLLSDLDDSSLSTFEIQRLLLAALRLVRFDEYVYARTISTAQVQALLHHNDRPTRYLASKLFCRLCKASEIIALSCLETTVGDANESVMGDLDGVLVDYIFLDLYESKQAEDLTALRTAVEYPETLDALFPSNLSPYVSQCGSILVPRVAGPPSRQSALVPTATTQTNIENFAAGLLSPSPVLIYGLSGSGKTTLVNDFARELGVDSSMVTLHLNEQTDAKMLIGLYTTDSTPGSFKWRPGVLTTAVKEGRWVFIEDFDRAPNDVISVILPLIERGELLIPSRGETIRAASGFRLIASMRTTRNANGTESTPSMHMLGARLWHRVAMQMPSQTEFEEIIGKTHPILHKFIPGITAVYERVYAMTQKPSSSARGYAVLSRPLGPRDLLKWCRRLDYTLTAAGSKTGEEAIDDSTRYGMFLDAIDCFTSSLPSEEFRNAVISAIAQEMHIPPQQVEHYLTSYVPKYETSSSRVTIGRVTLSKNTASAKAKPSTKTFANTTYTRRLLEQVGFAVKMAEPILLVGETGIGKTTVIQQLADSMGFKLTAVNLSQQSEAGDLLGGFKPVNVRNLAIPLKEEFEELFALTGISKTNNQRYFEQLDKCVAKGQWAKASKLWHEAPKMFNQILTRLAKKDAKETRGEDEQPTKRRKTESKLQTLTKLKPRWQRFSDNLRQFDIQLSGGSKGFAFSFVEGNIIKAARNGEWVLLDEINLASSDTLESIADLLHSGAEGSPSILLSETGQIERIKAHPDFRIFGAMNPATDVGKRDLPLGLRSRFSEIYVHSPDRDLDDLLAIIRAYLKDFTHTDERAASDIARLYINTKRLAAEKRLVDGANQVPHFSLRTLTRVLSYAVEIAPFYGLRRALYEGFAMGFLTLLNRESEKMLQPLIDHHLLSNHKNPQALLAQTPKVPEDGRRYVRFVNKNKNRQYWMLQGKDSPQTQPHYIITPSVERNMLNLVRATSTRRFPVLIQGPTSAGKTSMIEYLAKFSGNRFVRINNHEHTDLQEYLGSYVSGLDGQLRFQEGLLVQALRQGHWIVLDELNLAPTDVLEALNRLLDDNRELLIPETQEIVRPHENFMLFATQNPAGLYGGRKTLSRAFRNRFLELHFDDIPEEELEHILEKRSQKVAPSDCKRIVSVYRELSRLRQSDRLFEQKDSFATLRDLFRWALRDAENREQLAANGYMLLAERVRKPEERDAVRQVIEKIMKVKLDPKELYGTDIPEILAYNNTQNQQGVVWTHAMRRLYYLVAHALRNNEPVLLVGETGCGKTTVCQMLADAFKKQLLIVNAHQNTETGDLIGAQRPVRNRAVILGQLEADLKEALELAGIETIADIDVLQTSFSKLDEDAKSKIPQELQARIAVGQQKSKALFEWCDGSLVQAMKEAQFFLLDEISLADDSVLERLNSVLEPHRTLLLAEKGTNDSVVVGADGFQFLATMNPGGDYGKRELSPALRNRFTEIWVPALSDLEDVIHIVESKLKPEYQQSAKVIVDFAHWFGQTYRSNSSTSISVRDILAWVNFMNNFKHADKATSLLQGASMVYIDTLGANPAALLAIDPETIHEERQKCLDHLTLLMKEDMAAVYQKPASLSLADGKLSIGDFSIEASEAKSAGTGFAFEAPTTKMNAMRVIRALQVQKPILIEGSPGVGKTTLVAALASAAGKPLTRINLSEQTDLMDLFGSDVPVEGAEAGHFAWRDAPFLQAMQNGHWVLLDEMNLASQSVLEGLNACLDHRGEVYISELDQTFKRHPNFLVFAAQNPHHQGGGRKGLPSSFVNRFTVVYADTFKTDDLMLICKHYYNNLPEELLVQMIKFIAQLEQDAVHKHKFGLQGAPWEFNLRDVLRWLQLLSSTDPLIAAGSPADFLNLIFRQRFRTTKDREYLDGIYTAAFGSSPPVRHFYHNMSPDAYQVGRAYLQRHRLTQRLNFPACDIRHRLGELESVMTCVQQNLPCILVGPSGCGKSILIQHVAAVTGAELVLFPLNTDIDTMDLVGGFEQMDPQRAVSAFVQELTAFIHTNILESLPQDMPSEVTLLFDHLTNGDRSSSGFLKTTLQLLGNLVNRISSEQLKTYFENCQNLLKKASSIDQARFEWVDGVLVKALEQGHWLVLDNANLCSSSVLDRLNSLLEPNGVLIINEHCGPDGEPKTIKPHPNFRLFLTMDPQHGELSRAMRNRSVEIFMEPIPTGEILTAQQVHADESLMQRFSLLRSALVAKDLTSDLAQTGLEHLSFFDQSLLSRFDKELQNGLLPDSASSEFQVIQEYIQMISTESFVVLREAIIASYKKLEGKMTLPSSFGQAQANYPLASSPIALLLQQLFQTDEAFTLATAQEIRLELVRAKNAVRSHIEKLRGLKPSKMTRLQRSSIREESKAVQNDSTIGLHNFLVAFGNALGTYLETIPQTEALIDWKIQRAALKTLMQIWWETYRLGAASTFQEAQFQAHLAVTGQRFDNILAAISTVGVSPAQQNLAGTTQQLRSELKRQFEYGFKLSTGLSMEMLWIQLRPTTVSREEVLTTLLEMESLAAKFDSLRWRTTVSVPALRSIMSALVGAYKLVLTSTADAASLIQTLKEELSALEAKTGADNADIVPFFSAQFETLRQYHALENIGSDREDFKLLLDTDVNVLADYSTRSLMRLTSSTEASKLFRSVSVLGEVEGKFTPAQHTLSLSLLSRLRALGDVDLRSLKLLEAELPILGKAIATSTVSLSKNPVFELNHILVDLLLTIVAAHDEEHKQEIIEWLQAAEANLDANVSSPSASYWTEMQLFNDYPLRDVQTIPMQRIKSILNAIVASKKNQAEARVWAAIAWITFAVTCFELYIPDKPFDPDQRQRLEREQHIRMRDALQNKLAALRHFEKIFTGQDSNLQCEIVEDELNTLGEPQESSLIVRPQVSELENLQGEFNNLLKLLILPASQIEDLCRKGTDELQTLKVLQRNATQVSTRLSERYAGYQDLTVPVNSMLRCLKLGFSLAEIAASPPPSNANMLSFIAETAPLMGKTPTSTINSPPSNQPFEALSLLSFYGSVDQDPKFRNGHRKIILDTFHSCYEQWKTKLEEDRKEAESKSGLYRFKGSAEDEEEHDREQFNELFPTYDEDNEEDEKPLTNNTRDTTVAIATIHAELLSNDQIPKETLLSCLRTLSRYLGRGFDDSAALQQHELTGDLVPSVLLQIDDEMKALSSDTLSNASYNFYNDANLPEIRKLVDLIHRVQTRFSELQHDEEIGHMQPIEDVLASCRELLQFAHREPLAKIITKVEKIHAFMHEWQFGGWVAKANTAPVLYDDLTKTVVNWRRLELSTWAKLFDTESEKCEDDARSWWFVAYEVAVAGPLSLAENPDELSEYAQKLLQDLDLYMASAIHGQYSQRLQILKQMHKHLELFCVEIPALQIIADSLINFISFYSLFEKTVKESIAAGRKTLEKTMKDVLLTASWKDTNIVALRDSAKRSHHKLFKIVRKYRELLARPVDQLIRGGIPEDSDSPVKIAIPDHTTPSFDTTALTTCEKLVPNWATKSKRFVNVNKSVSIMQQTSQLSAEAVDASQYLESFVTDLIASSQELQKETPSVLTEENNVLVKHLKTRKRKLYADVLKELRQMGIKYNLGEDTLAAQDSLAKILASSPVLAAPYNTSAVEVYYHKALDLAVSARASIKGHSEDLTKAEVARSIGLIEGLLRVIVKQRGVSAKSLSQLSELKQVLQQAESLWAPMKYNVIPIRQVSNSHAVLRRLAPVLQVGSEILSIQQSLSQSTLSGIQERLAAWVKNVEHLLSQWDSLPTLPTNVTSTVHENLVSQSESSLQTLVNELERLAYEYPEAALILIQVRGCISIQSSDIPAVESTGTIAELDKSFSEIVDTTFVAIEQLKKAFAEMPTSTEDQSWLVKADGSLSKVFTSLRAEQLLQLIKSALSSVSVLDLSNIQTGQAAAALTAVSLPVLQQYCNILESFAARYAELHRSTSKTFCILAKSFIQIATRGFCTPSEQSESQGGKAEKTEEGTGLGEGEASEDISKDIQEDEDLSELAQEPNQDKDGEMENEEDAVDMADGDMEGEMGEAEEQEKEDGSGDEQEGDELDEEAGDVDDLDPNAVDEKMWDGDDEEAEKDQEGDKSKGKQQKDELAGASDEQNNEQAEDGEGGDEEEEEEQAGDEQGEDVKDNDMEKHDPHADEGENLDLPEDMQLDGGDEDENDAGMDEGLDDMSDLGDMQDEKEDQAPEEGGEQLPDGEDADVEEEPDPSMDIDAIDVDEDQDGEKTDQAGEKEEEAEDQNEEQSEEKMEDNTLQGQDDNAIAADETVPSEAQGTGENQDDTSADTKNNADSSAQREQGEQGGEGSESKQAAEEEEDASQEAQGSAQDGEDKNSKNAADSQPFKKLGDALEQWHRQNNIQDASEEDKQDREQPMEVDEQKEFQHLQDENAAADTQALGASTEDQAMPYDESMALDDDSKEVPEAFQPDEVEKDEVDESMALDVAEQEDAPANPYEGREGAKIHEAEEEKERDPDGTRYGRSKDAEEDVEEVDNQLSTTHLDDPGNLTLIPASEAHSLWAQYEAETRDLSLSLTEQLRLILAPTLATKMRGDFRTGKRLNIKRIIPYIASQYKRDKIWMRRSVPSKRSYQILLAVDDSKSMGDYGSGTLALETLVMISKSLSMLEVGEIGVVGFGEDVKLAHDFSAPFSSDAGPRILQNFSFAQKSTNVTKLVKESLDLFRAARAKASSSPADLWQLQLIISDGVCNSREHDSIRRLVREALEERIMMVFVIVDDVSTKKKGESVLDLKEARFVKDEFTGADRVKIERYLDTFPFRYYIVVSDVRELPGVLAALLRQWFAEVADSS